MSHHQAKQNKTKKAHQPLYLFNFELGLTNEIVGRLVLGSTLSSSFAEAKTDLGLTLPASPLLCLFSLSWLALAVDILISHS